MRTKPLVVATLLAVTLPIAACNSGNSDSASPDTTITTTTKNAAEISATQAANASAAASRSAAAAERERQQAEAAARAEAERQALLDPNNYAPMASRDFALMVKNPSNYVGQKVLIYGRVSQLDAATGSGNMLARTAANQVAAYDFDENTWIQASSAVLADVVEDDLVAIYAEVVGAKTYDTQSGGSTTVPHLKAHIVQVYGSADN